MTSSLTLDLDLTMTSFLTLAWFPDCEDLSDPGSRSGLPDSAYEFITTSLRTCLTMNDLLSGPGSGPACDYLSYPGSLTIAISLTLDPDLAFLTMSL